jgi:hypothetical protein
MRFFFDCWAVLFVLFTALTACETTYRNCESACAPLRVEEYQPDFGRQGLRCVCVKPKEGFAMESNVAVKPADPTPAGK